jgi:hypothetical protein
MGEPIKWLSASKLSIFNMCPRKVYYQYVEKYPRLSSGFFLLGKAVHSVIEKALRSVLGGDSLPSAKEMDDFYDPIWEAQVKEEEERDDFLGWQFDDGDSIEASKKDGRGLIRVAREEVLEKLDVILVEHNFHLDLDAHDSGPFRLYGVVDVFEKGPMITDWKTTRKVSANARKLDIQFQTYAFWARKYLDLAEDVVIPGRKIFLVRSKKPKVEVQNFEITQKDREWFLLVAAEVWKCIKANAFPPNTNGWWCGPKWCDFYNECRGE